MNWTEKEREKERKLTSLVALMVTDWEETDWEGIPEITPVSGLRDSPEGRDPETRETTWVEDWVRMMLK